MTKTTLRNGKVIGREISIDKVIGTLRKDDRLVAQWRSFGRQLGLTETDKTEIERRYSDDEFLVGVLSYWISSKGSNATVKSLVTALKKGSFAKCAENIEKKKFPMHSELTYCNESTEQQESMDVETSKISCDDDDLEDLCSGFCNTEVEEYDMVLENVPDVGKSDYDDQDFGQKILKGLGEENIVVSKSKRYGPMKPKLLKYQLKAKKHTSLGHKLVDLNPEQIQQCLKSMSGCKNLLKRNINAMDIKQAEFRLVEFQKQENSKTKKKTFMGKVVSLFGEFAIGSIRKSMDMVK